MSALKIPRYFIQVCCTQVYTIFKLTACLYVLYTELQKVVLSWTFINIMYLSFLN